MNKVMLLFLSFFVVGVAQAAKKDTVMVYKRLPYVEKNKKERGLTFRLTFDKNKVNADFAKGSPNPIKGKGIELGLRGLLGFDGANAFKIEKGESLSYSVPGNIAVKRGTIIFWIKAENYSPKDVKESGDDLCHKGYIHVKFCDGKEWVEFFFYQYYSSPTAYFYWQNSYPKSIGSWKICPVSLKNISKEKWFQIAATWDGERIKTYLNGEFQGTISLPPKANKTLALKPSPKESSIDIRKCVFGPKDSKFGKDTVVDDISIYDYPMSDIAIKKQYMAVTNVKNVVLPDVALSFNGVDRGDGDLSEVEVAMDFNALPDAFFNCLKKGGLKAEYELFDNNGNSSEKKGFWSGLNDFLFGRGGAQLKGVWKINKPIERRLLRVRTQCGYLLKLTLTSSDNKVITVSKTFKVPDLKFVDNRLGKSQKVPKPWNPVSMKDDIVSVWHRKYFFSNAPFPCKIEVDGADLLKSPPELIITTPRGVEKIKYEMTGKNVNDLRAVIRGQGVSSSFTIDYKTTIEYDGLITCDFTINGSPDVVSMKIAWTVKHEFDKFFLSPTLNHDMKGAYEFPGSDWRCVRQLWIASERGGFCWAPSSDANWIFKPGQKVLKIDRKPDGATCELDMITHLVRLPPSTPYKLLFIATPTRPAPHNMRSAHMGYNKVLLSTRGEGQTAFGEFSPDPVDFPELVKNRKVDSVAMYNFTNGLTDSSETGMYFSRYWEIPSAFVYSMRFKHRGNVTSTNTISCCPSTSYSDFILGNIKKLFDDKYGDRIWVIYYDLCGIRSCSNALHGCSFKDKFGRRINRSLLLPLREHLKRTTAYSHERGRQTIYHAQNVFNPMVHGFADFWFCGEQFRGKTTRNSFAYCDDIDDDIYQSEFNQRILGSALLFLPALNGKSCTDASTLSMFTQLLLQDIPSSTSFNKFEVAKKVFNILDEYDLGHSVVRRYYEQKDVISTNPDIRITYYICSHESYLFVLANTTKKEQEGIIDFSSIKKGDYDVRSEFDEKYLPVKNGRIYVKIPPRMFMLVGLRDKFFSDFSTEKWGDWKNKVAKGRFLHNKTEGRAAKGCLEIATEQDNPKATSLSFLKRFPARPGKTYKAIVWYKVVDATGKTAVSISFQGQDVKTKFLGTPVISKRVNVAGASTEWKRLNFTFEVPNNGKWRGLKYLLCCLGMSKGGSGGVLFDDFSFMESNEATANE